MPISMKVPFAKKFFIENSISLFCRSLGLLLEGGISLLASIGIARQAVPNRYLVSKMHNLLDYIKNGQSLSDSLHQTDFFTSLALDMIRVGESSANLEGMLMDVADVYDESNQERIETFVSLIEPVVIIFMGILVAFMLLSVYLPIFNLMTVTQ